MKKQNLVLVMLIMLSITMMTQAAVIGVDLGTEYIKVGIVKPGSPIDLVLNEQSKRKTTAFIGYRGKERLFGYNARQMNTRIPKGIAKYLKMIYGQKASAHSQTYERYMNQLKIPYKLTPNKERNTFDVLLMDKETGKENKYTVESLLGQLLEQVKKYAEKDAKMPITDCILTVPTYFTIEQRRGMKQIAEIAGLNVIALMQETTAMALQYGITKYAKHSSEGERIVVFYDMGAATTKVSVARFSPPPKKNLKNELGTIKMIGHAWNTQLGGIDFTIRVANYIADEFQKEHGTDLRTIPRAWQRIMETAKKTKEVLTANSERVIYIESLHNDISFKTKITREQFENLCQDLIEEIQAPIMQALRAAKITSMKKIHSIEVVGGASRVVAVQKELQRIFKKKLSHSLNGDEAIALGASFYAAMLSPRFRVRNFNIKDTFPFEIKFALSSLDPAKPAKEYTLFKAGDLLDNSKSVNVPRNEDFSIDIFYADADQLDTGFGPSIAHHDIHKVKEVVDSNFAESLKNETLEAKAKVRLTIELSQSGELFLSSAQATLEYATWVPEKTKKSKSKKKAKEETESNEEPKLVKKMEYQKVDLQVTGKGGDCLPISDATMKDIISQLKAMTEAEAARLALSEARNTLESYIYQTQYTMLEDDVFKPYYTESEKSVLIKKLEEADQWMLDNEYNENMKLNDFQSKLGEMKALSDPIVDRKVAHEAREEAVAACKESFSLVDKLLKRMEASYDHITAAERDAIRTKRLEASQTLQNQLEKQSKLSLAEPPIMMASEIQKGCDAVLIETRALLLKPKPVPVIEKEKESNSTTSSKDKSDPTTINDEAKEDASKSDTTADARQDL